MKSFSLNGPWTLEIPGSPFGAVPAKVPGSVYHDLLTAELIPDPFYRDNETQALGLMEYDFHYSRGFSLDAAFLDSDAVLLRCEGLDTLATVYINGAEAGRADNMHRTWEFDVRSLLHAGENRIEVRLASPTKYIREQYAVNPADGSSDAMEGFPNLRKAHCMFGWDWGPRLPDAGIWRDISLIGVDKARIRDVLVEQFHEDGRVRLKVHTNITRITDAPTEVAVSVTAPDGTKRTGEGACCEIEIADPRLWWPAGYGEQPLYNVQVTLLAPDAGAPDRSFQLDTWSRHIGLRTMTVSREKRDYGETFSHCVNGVDVFAMGMDYIPEDNLLPRVNPARTRRLLEDARRANVNTIRVWGGGYYPDDYFYDICDELGLLVWQDFMFACAVYNLTDAFEETIVAEFRDNIRRIRSHPSLALWCGNNEMEEFVAFNNEWVKNMRQKSDYIKMYQYILPKVVKAEDPQAFYWPSSPSSGGDFDAPQDPTRGDVHDWDVWHGLKPFTDYRNYLFAYVSEFGFQSFPCMETIESFTLPEDRNLFSYVMEKHQRNSTANGRIVSYLSQMYLYPGSLNGLVYASQLLQAQAMQYGVEHWRRNRGRCMGAVIWQLNDCWPVASWAALDYFGRWKALQYYAKRFFAPVLVSCHEEGLLNQEGTSVNTERIDPKKTTRLNVSNETMTTFTGRVSWALRRPDATVIEEGSFDVDAPALTAVWLPQQDFTQYSPYDCYYSYRLTDAADRVVGEGSVLFCAPKHFRFEDPRLTARLEDDEIVVTAAAYARSVEIRCGADVVLEDNFFDMDAGERRVKIVRGEVKDVSARSVYDIR